MTRTLTNWTRFPRFFGDFDAEFPKLVEGMFGPEGTLVGEMKFVPEVNLAETETAVEATIELPGLKPEEIKVEVHDGQLWITGEKKEEKEEQGKRYHRVERRTGMFRRVLPLPAVVDDGRAEAKFTNGVLKVTLPKTAEARPTAIPVK